jgi:hypothetical protein
VSRQRRAPPTPQQLQAIVEEPRQPADAEGVDPAGGQFDRERDPVEPAADVGHERRIRIRQLETVKARGGALDEQLHRRKRQRLGSRQSGRPGWNRERRQAMQLLAFDQEWLATGGKDMDVGSTFEHFCNRSRDRFNDVLAVVEHKQHLFVLKERDYPRDRVT